MDNNAQYIARLRACGTTTTDAILIQEKEYAYKTIMDNTVQDFVDLQKAISIAAPVISTQGE